MIKLIPLGGAEDIGASCYYLFVDGTGLLLDCGIHPRKTGIESLPNFDKLNHLPLDAVIISHAHQDHIGGLPFLIKKFPHVKIYSTVQTVEIARLTLHNTVSIFKGQLEEWQSVELYSHEEVELLLKSVHTLDYKEEFFIRGIRHETSNSIGITFYDAGHILGSASILLNNSGTTIFYTGDICLSNQAIMSGAELPKCEIDILITESTYASTNSDRIGAMEHETIRLVNDMNKILAGGGSVLIPVFALGKSQELLARIHESIIKKKLTETIIYTGGLSRKISDLYDSSRYIVNRLKKDLVLKEIEQVNYVDVLDYNQFRKKPGIVLATSGMMLESTYSHRFAEFWLRQKSFGIFIVGYIDDDTPGYKIVSSDKGDTIAFGKYESVKIRCQINRYYFPSHSRREELLQVVDSLKPDKIIIVHGEPEAHNWFGSQVLEKYPSAFIHSAEIGREIGLN
jgi:Cft2 family RNA processing exonuclease